MKKSKVYVIEAKVRVTKDKIRYRSSWIEVDKKIAKKVYDNFKDLGKIKLIIDEENKDVLTFWANIWNDDIDIDYGRYIIKMQVTEGNEAYPNPSISILEATFISKDSAEAEVLEEVNFIETKKENFPKVEPPIAPLQVEETETSEESDDLPF